MLGGFGHLSDERVPPRIPYVTGWASRPSATSVSASSRTTRAGLPTAITPDGMDPVTTLPAPMTEWAPMVTPLRIMTRSPMNTF